MYISHSVSTLPRMTPDTNGFIVRAAVNVPPGCGTGGSFVP
jgi:hypothetical protein